MISADSKYFAADAANCIIKTAPKPKFGAMSAPTFGWFESHDLIVASFASSKPVVPTTTEIS
ncbi:unannotated protein [freshwater metagenome]|uniref:Unannotated protein n=1 Tax=freshwater metagenome TaxID=449393 RepID=A0A6J6BK70_9ZZZZ